MTRRSTEARSGAIIAAAGVVLLFLVIAAGRSVTFGTRKVYLIVPSAPYIEEGTPVRIAGTRAGRVTHIHRTRDAETGDLAVRLTLSLDEELFEHGLLRENASGAVVANLLGESTVILHPGGPGDAPPLPPNGTIEGGIRPDLSEAVAVLSETAVRVSAAAGALERAVASWESGIGGRDAQEQLKSTLAETRLLVSEDLRGLVRAIDAMVRENRPKIDRTLTDLSTAGDSLKTASSKAGETLDALLSRIEALSRQTEMLLSDMAEATRKNREEASQSHLAVQTASEKMRSGVSDLVQGWQALAADLQTALKTDQDRASSILDSLEKATKNLEQLSRKLAENPSLLMKDASTPPAPPPPPPPVAPTAAPDTVGNATGAKSIGGQAN